MNDERSSSSPSLSSLLPSLVNGCMRFAANKIYSIVDEYIFVLNISKESFVHGPTRRHTAKQHIGTILLSKTGVMAILQVRLTKKFK